MKFLYLYSLEFLLLLIGCTNKNDFESNEHFDIDDLIGVYEIKVAENTTGSDNSWMYSKRQNRNLTLNLDSTYVDINISFEAFDFVDYYGKWQIFGNKIKLTPIGQLRYENGQYFKDSLTHTFNLDVETLILLTGPRLKHEKEGLLHNKALVKIN